MNDEDNVDDEDDEDDVDDDADDDAPERVSQNQLLQSVRGGGGGRRGFGRRGGGGGLFPQRSVQARIAAAGAYTVTLIVGDERYTTELTVARGDNAPGG